MSNFSRMKTSLMKSINSADLIAIDFEFSGLHKDPMTKTSDYDSHETRYKKMSQTVTASHAYQLGMTTFKFDQ